MGRPARHRQGLVHEPLAQEHLAGGLVVGHDEVLDELPALFSFSPQALTPIGALLTVANVEAAALVTPDLATPDMRTARRIIF
jgi:hypothetical protein